MMQSVKVLKSPLRMSIASPPHPGRLVHFTRIKSGIFGLPNCLISSLLALQLVFFTFHFHSSTDKDELRPHTFEKKTKWSGLLCVSVIKEITAYDVEWSHRPIRIDVCKPGPWRKKRCDVISCEAGLSQIHFRLFFLHICCVYTF